MIDLRECVPADIRMRNKKNFLKTYMKGKKNKKVT